MGKIIKIPAGLKGSFTVEASIVFSIVFLLLAVLIYLFIILYQYAFLQSIANRVVNEGACYYVNQYNEDLTQKTNSNLYWRIVDTDAKYKKNMMLSYINQKLSSSILNSDKFSNIETPYRYLTKQLNIKIEEQYPMPVGNLFFIFGVSPTLNLKAEAFAPFNDKTEFVRNLDTVIDIKNCILNSDNKWIGENSKVGEVVGKLLKKN